MTASQQISFLLFVGSVATIYVLAGRIVIVGAYRRLAGKKVWRSRRSKVLAAVILTLGALGIVCMAYGYFIEPYWLDVTHVRIVTAKLPPGREPIRLVHISDTHCDSKRRLEGKLPEAIAGLDPDLIVFTGDAINDPRGLVHFKRCMSRLAELAPTFAVEGNWDVAYFADQDLFGGTGVRLLKDEPVACQLGGTKIWIAGLAPDRPYDIDRALEAARDGDLTIFLYHYPDLIFELGRRGVDLYCAGHTHGGQVAIPFYGALVTLSKYGKRFERGLHRVGETWMYVSRGIGMEGGPAPRVRFFARPEVTLIEICPAPAGAASGVPTGELDRAAQEQ